MIHGLLITLGALRYEQPPLYYCVSCGGHYPFGHFCQ